MKLITHKLMRLYKQLKAARKAPQFIRANLLYTSEEYLRLKCIITNHYIRKRS